MSHYRGGGGKLDEPVERETFEAFEGLACGRGPHCYIGGTPRLARVPSGVGGNPHPVCQSQGDNPRDRV